MAERIEYLFVCTDCASQLLLWQLVQEPRMRLEPRCCAEPMWLAVERYVWEQGWARVRVITTYEE